MAPTAGGRWAQQPVQTRRSPSATALLCLHLQVTCGPSRVAPTSIPAYVEVDAVSGPTDPEEHLPQTPPPGVMRSSSAAACLCSRVQAHPNYRSLGVTRVLHDVLGTKVNVFHLCASPSRSIQISQRCLMPVVLVFPGPCSSSWRPSCGNGAPSERSPQMEAFRW